MARKRALAATAASLVAIALHCGLLSDPPPIPDPVTGAMEPQVADKIRLTRKEVAENISSGEAWGKLGMIFHAHYLEAEAEPCYAEAHRLDDEDFRWPYLLAQVLKSRDREAALAALEEARQLKADYAPLHILEGELREAEGDGVGALSSYRRALSLDRGSAAAEFGIGRLALEEGDLEQSRSHLERAAELAPESGSIQATLARVFRRLGQEDQANRATRHARMLHPDVDVDDPVLAAVTEQWVSLAGHQARALRAEQAGDPIGAEALLRRIIELRPDDADLYYNLANHLSRQGRTKEAQDSYRDALRRDEGHVPSLVNLGILAAQNGDSEKAAQFFRQALESEPDHAGALLGLGNLALARGRLIEAVRLLERALEADPNRPDIHYALARALAASGAVDGAIEHFHSALEAEPQKIDIHFHLAALYARRHDQEAVERHIRMARENGAEPSPELLRTLRKLSKGPEQNPEI